MPQAVNSVYGNFPLYPDIKVSSSPVPQSNSNGSNEEHKVVVNLDNPSWNKSWDTQEAKPISVASGQSFTIEFGVGTDVDTAALEKSVKIFTGTPPVEYDGKLIIAAPKVPDGLDGDHFKPSATVYGPAGTQQIKFSKWDSSEVLEKQMYGEYTVHTDAIERYQGGSDTKLKLTEQQKEGQAALSYIIPEKLATLDITLPQKADGAADKITLNLKEITKGTAATQIDVDWGKPYSFNNLTAGDQYKLSTAQLTIGETKYIPQYNGQESDGFAFAADSKAATKVGVSYRTEVIPVTKYNVLLRVSGLPAGETGVNVSFAGEKYSYKHVVHNGVALFDKVVVGQYNVAADVYSTPDKEYQATLNNPYNIDKDGIVIDIVCKEIPKAEHQYAVYWASWSPWQASLDDDATAYLPKVTILNLSFGNIRAAGGSFAVEGSDGILDENGGKIYGTPYGKWTLFKFHHPQTKVLLAIGGASYSSIWNSLLTKENAKDMAAAIAKAVNYSYPVYKFGQWQTFEGIQGYVQLDGVDLDVEAGSRLTNQDAVIILIKELKQLMPNKLVTLTTLSVAADPESCQTEKSAECSFPYSNYSGEHVKVLEAVGNIIDNVNIMAYDAGRNYPYKIAVKNYIKYVAKEKILLGLDLESQWDPVQRFVETEAELKNRASWTTHNTDIGIGAIGGAMVWAYGASPSGYSFDDQRRLIKEFGDQL